MPRKTAIPREGIKEKSIAQAKKLAIEGGLESINVRNIAGAVGCSVGTLYNVVGDLNTIILFLNQQTTQMLTERLRIAASTSENPIEKAHALAETYIEMGLENTNLWEVLFLFTRNSKEPLPAWYLETLAEPVSVVMNALSPLYQDAENCQADVAILWSGLHGIVALSLGNKYRILGGEDPKALAHHLVASVLHEKNPRESIEKR